VKTTALPALTHIIEALGLIKTPDRNVRAPMDKSFHEIVDNFLSINCPAVSVLYGAPSYSAHLYMHYTENAIFDKHCFKQ